MSFSKAKIIRFNDTVASTPSTTNYNLSKDKAPDKPKKANANSVGPSSPATSENGSVKSVPGSFKTPTLPKKTKTATPATKIKPKDLFTNDLVALNKKTEECEQKTEYIHKLTAELDGYKKELENLKSENDQLQREHQNEIQELEFEMLKTMTQLQKQEEESAIKLKEIEEKLENEIEKLQKTHKYEFGQIVLEYEIKLKEHKEDTEGALKRKIEELEDVWRQKLEDQEKQSDAILKECQAISEYNIIQCELEKNNIQKSLDELRVAYKSLQKKYDKLVANQEESSKTLAIAEKKLEQKIIALNEHIQEKEEEIKKLNIDIKAYQITLNNSQVTIEVLKKRLFDSDKDVEQLKQEITRCEEKLIDYESRYFQLSTELKEAKDINEELELQNEAAIKCNETSINQLKEELLGRVDEYEKLVKQYKNNEERHLQEEIKEQSKLIEQINLQLKSLEQNVDNYVVKETIWNEKIEKLKEKHTNNQNLLEEKETRVKELEESLNELSEKNLSLNDRYMFYKTKSEELEAETKESSQTVRKYIDVSGKYDALLQDFDMLKLENKTYQNRISGLSEKLESLLKIEEEFEKLKKEKERLESENLSYKNKFDEQKLKKYKFAAKDKENLGSPNRSVVESPNRGSPFRGSPFRERN